MKLAITGKGGAGKTALAALCTRVLAERGRSVLAVDLDRSPGLAVSLGIDAVDIALPDEAIEERAEALYGWGLASGMTAAEAVARYGTRVSDGVTFVGQGNINSARNHTKNYVSAVRAIVEEFDEPGWDVVVDLEAGPSTPFQGYAAFASLAFVCIEATPASVFAARRIISTLDYTDTPTGIVVTKGRPGDTEWVAAELGSVLATIPFDVEVRTAEQQGSLAMLGDGSDALHAVRLLCNVAETTVRGDEMMAR
ncbi:MAG TPA: hypothetical protein VM784_02340 [Actinomycetota bacterium]|nr:hypothetical protein [Actinomycetota bacterium]